LLTDDGQLLYPILYIILSINPLVAEDEYTRLDTVLACIDCGASRRNMKNNRNDYIIALCL